MQGGGRSSRFKLQFLLQNLTKEVCGQQDLIDLASKSHCLTTPSLITADDYYKANGLNNINLQLHASSEVSNPYSFNILKDYRFSAKCASKNAITVTIGEATHKDGMDDKTTYHYYGYGPEFGKCSPSTYRGIEISSIYIQATVSDTAQGPNENIIFCINFAKHVNINSINAEGVICSINKNNHVDYDFFGCMYTIRRDDNVNDFSYLLNLFTNNVDKQITIDFK